MKKYKGRNKVKKYSRNTKEKMKECEGSIEGIQE